ncbi:MAG TPA: (2Fe-2S)-binding protein [bacterium]|nr:(2Fe-2S)-binding protein [bacterium]
MKIEFEINNTQKILEVDPARRLLDILREDLDLTSVKEGCGQGECGACMVLMDDKAVNSCLIPAGNVHGKNITTVEGLRSTEQYKTIEQAFLDAGSVQCGFCTPGMVISAEALLRKNPDPDEDEIKEALEGNLCRCTGYNMIIEGVKLAAERGQGLW